ncbi:unnamed protein product [Spirodela intermedia]|uniref:Uncharacterized protein n=1 Tax=Spirodela intermedia TaxID=51605 RepID=A0A7I8KKD3_SPIIN|nr:unnamed protein product [Spirodela intermedia]
MALRVLHRSSSSSSSIFSSDGFFRVQEGGWPLGLRRLGVRIGLRRSGDLSGSMSFSTLISASPTSSIGSSSSSSDSDTQASLGSFFRDGGATTLGRLMELSGAFFRSGSGEGQPPAGGRRRRPRNWLLLRPCTRATAAVAAGDDVEPGGGGGRTPSLGHFLQAERRAGRRSQAEPYSSLYSNGGEAASPAAAPPGKRRRLSCMGVVLCGDCRR